MLLVEFEVDVDELGEKTTLRIYGLFVLVFSGEEHLRVQEHDLGSFGVSPLCVTTVTSAHEQLLHAVRSPGLKASDSDPRPTPLAYT